jgi:predicted dienelactone hydrolase
MKLRILFISLALLFAAGCGPAEQNDSNNGATADAGTDVLADTGADAGGDADDQDASTELPDRPWSVYEPGHYSVGYTEREITYNPRGQDESRTLRVAIWYPTFQSEKTDEYQHAVYYDLFRRNDILADVPVAVDEPMPLLVFSHGNSALAEQSYFMTENFASHGWVVASPDHTGNTVRDTQGSINLESAVFRPQDLSAVMDDMLSLPEDHRLAGLVDGDAIAVSGHSFGAVTTLAISGAGFEVDKLVDGCEQGEIDPDFCDMVENPEYVQVFRDGFLDERIDVAMPQAPGGYVAFGDGLKQIEIPTLLLTGGMDRTLPNEEEGDPIWATMEGSQHMRVNIPAAGHFTFSNMCDWFDSIDQIANDGCGPEFIDPALAYDIVNAYTLAWSRYHIFDDSSVAPLATGEEMPWSEVELSMKSGQ